MTRSYFLRLVLLAAALSVFPGCSDNRSGGPVTSRGPDLIEPLVRVGEIKAGMTVTQVVGLMGEPQRRTANALEYTSLGFAVMPGPDQVVQVIMCGDVTGLNGPLVKAFTARTREGIGLNSTRGDVVKAYGPPTRNQSFLGGRESLVYDSLGITFSLEGGKVHHMIVRFAPVKETEASIEVTR